MLRRLSLQFVKLVVMSIAVTAMIVSTLFVAQRVDAAPSFGFLSFNAPSEPVPEMVNYQGVVTVSGNPFSGTGYFKFAVVDSATGAGSSNSWANDGAASGEPATAVELAVSGGRFNVALGDTSLSGMTQALSADAFSQTDAYLRVWFSQSAAGPFEVLEPNQRFASVAYALRAGVADPPSGAVLFFDAAVCPAGWTEMTDAQGRTIVGMPSGGTLAGTVGGPLTDLENRAHTHDVDPAPVVSTVAGSHSHSVNPPAVNTSTSGSHTHGTSSANGSYYLAQTGSSGTQLSSPNHSHSISTSGSHFHSVDIPNSVSSTSGDHNHQVDVANTASSAAYTADAMPYLQLLVCRKN